MSLVSVATVGCKQWKDWDVSEQVSDDIVFNAEFQRQGAEVWVSFQGYRFVFLLHNQGCERDICR